MTLASCLYSQETHIAHLTPSLVVAIGGVVVLVVVGGLDRQLGIIGVMRVELKLTLKCSHVLSMDLVGESPEDTFPDETSLGIFETQVVFVVY